MNNNKVKYFHIYFCEECNKRITPQYYRSEWGSVVMGKIETMERTYLICPRCENIQTLTNRREVV